MKIFSRIFLPIITLWLCVFPALSYAALPAPVVTYGSSAKIYSFPTPASASSSAGTVATIGSMVMRASPWVAAASIAYEIYQAQADGKDAQGNSVPVNVLPSNASQVPAPGQTWSGWTKDAQGLWHPPQTVLPTIVSAPPYYTSHGYGPYATFDLAMQFIAGSSYATKYVFPPPRSTIDRSIGTGLVRKFTFDIVGLDGLNYTSANGIYIYSSEVSSCPLGYVLSGANCSLSNELLTLYPSDNVPALKVKPDGSGFQNDLRDPDNSATPAIQPMQFYGVGQGNVLQRISIVPSPDHIGGMAIKTQAQELTSAGETVTYEQEVVVDNKGKVQNSSAKTLPGSIVNNTNVVNNPIAPSTAPIPNMPTDYNRENTQLEIKNALSNQSGLAAAPNSQYNSVGSALDAYDASISGLSGGIDFPLPSFAVPDFFQPAACTPLSWTFGVYTMNYDICPYVPKIRDIGEYVLYLLTAVLLFQMFTRPPNPADHPA